MSCQSAAQTELAPVILNGTPSLLSSLSLLQTRLFISSEVPIFHIFSDSDESTVKSAGDVSDHMRSIMDDLGLGVDDVKASSMFTGQEELFAFARCVSRLVQMGTKEWAETAGKL